MFGDILKVEEHYPLRLIRTLLSNSHAEPK
jgi:hypothetical protein